VIFPGSQYLATLRPTMNSSDSVRPLVGDAQFTA
jgi:hypothetical protein